jgi:hypothetical protein
MREFRIEIYSKNADGKATKIPAIYFQSKHRDIESVAKAFAKGMKEAGIGSIPDASMRITIQMTRAK